MSDLSSVNEPVKTKPPAVSKSSDCKEGKARIIMSSKKSLLERLDEGEVILGDGGMISNLEHRGYVHAGHYTPEVVIEHPDAVRQLHREFVLSGADVLQPLTFYASNANLKRRGINLTCQQLSQEACRIAKEVAAESKRPIMVAGSLSETCVYTGKPECKEAVQEEFSKQFQPFIDNDVDFVVAEYFRYIEEIEWAIESLKVFDKPIVAMMNIGGNGDRVGVSTADCAVRMAEAGADVIGLNCCFDPQQLVEACIVMKKALKDAGYNKHIICQPIAYWTPDAGKDGYLGLPEYPFAMEPRMLTRFDMRKFARDAYDAGIMYIGGCCYFEAYHIREMADELSAERGCKPPNSDKMEPWGTATSNNFTPWIKKRANREFWENLEPSTGRPCSAAFSTPVYDPNWRSANGLPR